MSADCCVWQINGYPCPGAVVAVVGQRCEGCGELMNHKVCTRHEVKALAGLAEGLYQHRGGYKGDGCGGTILLLEAIRVRSAVAS